MHSREGLCERGSQDVLPQAISPIKSQDKFPVKIVGLPVVRFPGFVAKDDLTVKSQFGEVVKNFIMSKSGSRLRLCLRGGRMIHCA